MKIRKSVLNQFGFDWCKQVIEHGRKYGYPECCIFHFVNFTPELRSERMKIADYNGEYTGFIPCPEHAKQILSGSISLPDLITKRSPDLQKFPNDWTLK